MPLNTSKIIGGMYGERCVVNSVKIHRRLFQTRIIMPPLYHVHTAKSPLCSCRTRYYMVNKKKPAVEHRGAR